jgi:CRISPR-associated protein Csx10
MKALTFTIELSEPLLIANPVSGDENSATSLDYIPGSVIRGALAYAFTKGRRGDLSDDQFRKLFFGDVRFLNAYPVIAGERSLPTPRSWQRDKDANDKDPAIDLASGEAPKERQLKGLSQPFTHLQPPAPSMTEDDHDDDDSNPPPSAEMYAMERDISVHIAQKDRRDAVRTGTGDIYRYDALAPGQDFAGAIVPQETDALKHLAELLRATFKLGKSRSASYGAVKVTNVQEHVEWREYTPVSARDNSRVVVTLLSDAVVRNPQTGAYSASLDVLFGLQPLETFARSHIVGGFNLAWGLPLPQSHAIQAGSVFVFKRTDTLMAKLQEAEANGIGERRSDGFGRIAVDWHTSPQLRVSIATRESTTEPVLLTNGSAEHQLTQRMVDRIWRAQLDSALRDAIGKSKLHAPPQNAQLSRMRVLVREAWRSKDTALIRDVLEEPDKDGKNRSAMKRHARDQFEKAHISVAGESKRLVVWLKGLADKPETVWNVLQTDQLKRPEIGGVKAEDPLALEYAARLIEGVLRKAAKDGSD